MSGSSVEVRLWMSNMNVEVGFGCLAECGSLALNVRQYICLLPPLKLKVVWRDQLEFENESMKPVKNSY